MSIINTELSKVSFNFFLTNKISFANHLALLCEKIDGANVNVISTTLGNSHRISPYFLKGGLSFGGTCFPRDTKAFNALYSQIIGPSSLI